ncbi:MAG: 16S rRNA (cytosine(967)-C(5))-methyltransferase RsmB [Clostridiales bacterium]|nr:16S rRNA (cytosine(967)-C(5))-methyltransferase RsmB [Clostridiales bacterium]
MSGKENTRSIAVDILLAVDRDGEMSHLALRKTLDQYRFLPRHDRAFIRRVSMGSIERMIELDYIIDHFSKTKVKKMKPAIRAILRSAVYQMKYMDAVPDSAACNEAVKLAVQRGFSGLRGFVNGVLRGVCAGIADLEYPSAEEEPVRAISVRYSMPEWLVERFCEAYGRERCVHILEAFLNDDDSTCVRVDTNRESVDEVCRSLRSQGISVVPDDRLSYALHISGYDRLDKIPEFADGILYVQDIASMMVAGTAQPKEGDFILDVCAAPGGKSLHLAQMMRGTGMVEARDLTEYKVGLIRENISRCRAKNMRASVHDALDHDPEMEEKADIVIADLPCSGLGVIGRKADIKYRTSEEKIRELAALQRQILDVVRHYVRPGGSLLYSTCTMTKEENQENTAWFLKHNAQFSLCSEKQYLPDEGCDGFYIARFVRHAKTPE